MKKSIFIALFCAMFAGSVVAQNAIGIRGGYGLELSYQKSLGDANRLEADLGLGGWGGINLAGIYQWVWSLESIGLPQGFNWYAGPGADVCLGNWMGLGIGGQLGIEYYFPSVPLQLSLDYRPMYMFGLNADTFNWFGGSYALGFRYTF